VITFAFLLFVVLVALLLLRVPIALAMTLASMFFLFLMAKTPMIIVPQRLWGALESFPLLAIPFFVLAGILMNKSGGAERIFAFCLSILGHIRGGLGHVNIVASMIFAGMSGAATADAAGLGAIEIEAMRKDGYRPDFCAAVTAASSTIGPIIPPSVPLVVYGVMAQVSVGQLFLGGLLPGVLMGLVMMGVVAIKARKENYRTHPRASFQTVWRKFLSSSLSLLAPIIILGGIFSGAFTPTEAGVVASVYALFLGFVYRTIKPKELWAILGEAMLTTAQITFIVGAAGLFGWVITRAQIPASISSFLIALTHDKNIVLLLINFVMIFMGCFIDALALLIMMTPVVFPLGIAFSIDPVQLGLILVLNCMIGLITPPVGLCLYIVSNIAKIPIFQVARALIPFYIALAISLVLIIFIPQIVTFLPNLIKL